MREGGREVSQGGEDNLAVYALDQNSGEPKPIQHIDGCGVQLRTFGIDASNTVMPAGKVIPSLRSIGIMLVATRRRASARTVRSLSHGNTMSTSEIRSNFGVE